MKLIQLFSLEIILLLFLCCKRVDPIDYKPIYFFANSSTENINLVYTLQEQVSGTKYAQIDTVEIAAQDTISLLFLGKYENSDRMRPQHIFKRIQFFSLEGEKLLDMNDICDEQWELINIEGIYGDLFAYGWLYTFTAEDHLFLQN